MSKCLLILVSKSSCSRHIRCLAYDAKLTGGGAIVYNGDVTEQKKIVAGSAFSIDKVYMDRKS